MAQRSRGATAGARPAGRTGARPADQRRAGAAPADQRRAGAGSGPDVKWLRARLAGVVEPLVNRVGLDLEDLQVIRAGRRHVVRVVVDGDGGVDHDELTELSRGISNSLDEADSLAGADRLAGAEAPDAAEESRSAGGLGGLRAVGSYTLEVSSPGVDRPLTLPRHWRRNVGRLVKVKAGGRTVTGRVVATGEAAVTLDVAGRVETVAFGRLGPGRVQIEFNRLADLADEDFGAETADHDGDDTEDGAGGASGAANDAGDGAQGHGADQRHEGEDGA